MKYLFITFISSALLLSGQSIASTDIADIETVRSCNSLESIARDGMAMRQDNKSFDEALDYIISNYEQDNKGTVYELDSEGTAILENLMAAIYMTPIMPPENKEIITLMFSNKLLEACLSNEYNDDNIELE